MTTATDPGRPAAGAPAPTAADPAPPSNADARLDRLEQTQRQQGQVLERILSAVGGQPPAGQHAAPAGQAQPSAGDIAAQVRQEIADADQRRKAEEDEKTWRAGVTEQIEKLRAENAPREPETGLRARLQRAIVGKDPAREPRRPAGGA
jgi:hypothetical protein